MITCINKFAKMRLCEISQTSKTLFSTGIIDGKTIELRTPWIKCREFFNEVVTCNVKQVPQYVYGFDVTPDTFQGITDSNFVIIMNNVTCNAEELTDSISNVLNGSTFPQLFDCVLPDGKPAIFVYAPMDMLMINWITSFMRMAATLHYLSDNGRLFDPCLSSSLFYTGPIWRLEQVPSESVRFVFNYLSRANECRVVNQCIKMGIFSLVTLQKQEISVFPLGLNTYIKQATNVNYHGWGLLHFFDILTAWVSKSSSFIGLVDDINRVSGVKV